MLLTDGQVCCWLMDKIRPSIWVERKHHHIIIAICCNRTNCAYMFPTISNIHFRPIHGHPNSAPCGWGLRCRRTTRTSRTSGRRSRRTGRTTNPGCIVQRFKSLEKCGGSRSIQHDGVTMGNYDLLVSIGHLSWLVMILRDVSCLKNIEDMIGELVGINLSIWVIHGHPEFKLAWPLGDPHFRPKLRDNMRHLDHPSKPGAQTFHLGCLFCLMIVILPSVYVPGRRMAHKLLRLKLGSYHESAIWGNSWTGLLWLDGFWWIINSHKSRPPYKNSPLGFDYTKYCAPN